MGKETQNKHLKAHKITNVLFLILLVPCVLIALLSAIIMFNTKSAGGYANFLGYYVYEIQNDNFKMSTQFERYDVDPYVKGAKFLFHKVSIDDIEDGQFVIYYSSPGSDEPISTSAPDWVPLNNMVNPMPTEFVGEDDDLAELKMVQIGHKKAVITAEDGTRYTVFSYYQNIVDRGFDFDHTNAGSELLVYNNIVGVMAEDQNAFLMSVLEFCGSTSGFLTLVLIPCVLLMTIKLISLYFYRRWAHEEELIRDTEIMANDKVSYNQALRGARKSRAAQGERIISSTRGASAASAKPQSQNASKRGSTVPKTAAPKPQPKPRAPEPVARTAPKPRGQAAQTPVQRSAPKPRTPKTNK
ncbi:MAG: hypothetical protein IKB21_01820 [Clostridia bacterium]|nr:hypothetical protein [Clostridia bacterium]